MTVQDMPPASGLSTIKYMRNIPRRGPSAAVVLAGVFGIMTYGFLKTGEGNLERRELRREKVWARIHLIPLLEAEKDRDLVRRFKSLKTKEEDIMGNEWPAMDLKAPIKGIGKGGVEDKNQEEPVYHTKRYVKPSLVFVPPGSESKIDAQWWRGSTVLTKNPPYQNRDDFTDEHPIGK